jgi:hypothetical protein
MTVLYKKVEESFYEWSLGSTPLLTEEIVNGQELIISIKCSFGEHGESIYALFDTGARWTVIPQSIADTYPDCFSSLDILQKIMTRFGVYPGTLHQCSLRILVDSGQDIVFEPTVLVVPDWNYPIVLGFTSLLDKIRWACDPTANQEGRLYFGIDA